MVHKNEPNNLRQRKFLWPCGWMLSFWSGSINMIASYAILFLRVSHMTGPASDLSRFALTDFRMALFILFVIVSFVFGAYVSGVVAKRVKFSTNLMLSTIPAMVLMSLILTNLTFAGRLEDYIFAMLLPLGMGWQNGATSQSEIGRTTHVTGDITDIGLKIAEGDWVKAGYFGIKFLSFVLGGMTGLFFMGFSPVIGLVISVLGIAMMGVVINTFDHQTLAHKEGLSHNIPVLETHESVDMHKATANT